MASILYERVKELCARQGITINRLEETLDFGVSSIKKWERSSSPSIQKVEKVANYFHVSIDYLIGRTDIESPISEVLNDEDIISIQRAKERMSPTDRERMMQILRLGFDEAFKDSDN